MVGACYAWAFLLKMAFFTMRKYAKARLFRSYFEKKSLNQIFGNIIAY